MNQTKLQLGNAARASTPQHAHTEKRLSRALPPSLARGPVISAPRVHAEEHMAGQILQRFNIITSGRYRSMLWQRLIIARVREFPYLDVHDHRAIIESYFRYLNTGARDTNPQVVYGSNESFKQAMNTALFHGRIG